MNVTSNPRVGYIYRYPALPHSTLGEHIRCAQLQVRSKAPKVLAVDVVYGDQETEYSFPVSSIAIAEEDPCEVKGNLFGESLTILPSPLDE